MTETPVHPRLGLNSRRCFCGACGRDTDQIRNLGAYNYVRRCAGCGLDNYGGDSIECNRCGASMQHAAFRKLREDEKVSGPLCSACQTDADLALRMVENGGVFCVCKKCLTTFALPKDNPIAIRTRNLHDCSAPKVCRVSVDSCPRCPATSPGR